MGSGRYIKKKKEMKFQSVEALQQVVNVVNEASDALSDKKRTIRESAIPEVLLGAIGAGAGGAISFTALYGLGTVGLSAAGITSGLAAAGAGASCGRRWWQVFLCWRFRQPDWQLRVLERLCI